MNYDWIIVGAGYSGSIIAERIATQLDKNVLVVDRRDHIAGNAYDYYNEHGVLVHKYGPHIFHTNAARLWNYLSKFTEWRLYEHRVLAKIEGKKVPLPFNLNAIYQLFPPNYASKLEDLLLDEFGFGKKIPILKLKENQSGDLGFLADYIYDYVFKGYTAKQWGLSPEELNDSVTARVPVYVSRDNRYFQDTYQGIPRDGYTAMFENILDHPNIDVQLGVDGKEILNSVAHDRLVWTGPIDEYFDHQFGPLPYRSLRFKHITFDEFPYQEAAQVNYPNNYDFTRITEFRHLTGQREDKTTVAVEFSQDHEPGKTTPYYPVPKDEYKERYRQYAEEAKKIKDKVLFAGRLADYKYYDMDQVVARALHLFEKKIAENYA